MPLLDHFHAPLSDERSWESFHGRLAQGLADRLNLSLRSMRPSRYFAEAQAHFGNVEVDVATFERKRVPPPMPIHGAEGGGGTATIAPPVATPVYAPPAPNFVAPASIPDDIEVRIFSKAAGPVLVAAIELVSPRNKDRQDARTRFAGKCAAYLGRGVGLIVLDLVTDRRGNLHNELVSLMGWDERCRLAADRLYAAAYRPLRLIQDAQPPADQVEGWTATLAVGQTLPVLPLALDKGQVLPVDFESVYADACQAYGLV